MTTTVHLGDMKTWIGKDDGLVYRTRGDTMRSANALEADGPLPPAFWGAPTELNCLGTTVELRAEKKTILVVSSESREKVEKYIEKNGIPMTSLLDETGEATKAFGVKNLPTLFVIDAEGIVREHFVGLTPVETLVMALEKMRSGS